METSADQPPILEYDGPVQIGLPHGRGEMRLPNGIVLKGEFVDGRLNGPVDFEIENRGTGRADFNEGDLDLASAPAWRWGDGLHHEWQDWAYARHPECGFQIERMQTGIRARLEPVMMVLGGAGSGALPCQSPPTDLTEHAPTKDHS